MSLAHFSLCSLVVCSPQEPVPAARVCWVEHWVRDATGCSGLFADPMHIERMLAVCGPLGRIPDTGAIHERTVYGIPAGDETTAPPAPGLDWTRMPPSPLSLEGRYREWLQEKLTLAWDGYVRCDSDAAQQRDTALAQFLDQLPYFHTVFGTAATAPAFDGKVSDHLEGPWGLLKTQVQIDTTKGVADAPLRGERWQTEDALQVPVAGPLFVFGKFQGGYNTLTAQEATMTGHTGVGCKLQPIAGAEIQVRGGSRLCYQSDPLRPDRLPRERRDLVLE